MIGKPKPEQIILCILTVWLSVQAFAFNEPESQVIPLPIAEISDVIESYFEQSGYGVVQHHMPSGLIQMIAIKQDEVWTVNLIHHSALETKVSSKIESETTSESANKLFTYLAGYIKLPSAPFPSSLTISYLPNFM